MKKPESYTTSSCKNLLYRKAMLSRSIYIHFSNTSLNLDEIHCLSESNASSSADISVLQPLQKPHIYLNCRFYLSFCINKSQHTLLLGPSKRSQNVGLMLNIFLPKEWKQCSRKHQLATSHSIPATIPAHSEWNLIKIDYIYVVAIHHAQRLSFEHQSYKFTRRHYSVNILFINQSESPLTTITILTINHNM